MQFSLGKIRPKNSATEKNEKKPWKYAHNDAKYQKSAIYDHPVSLEARAKTRKNGLFWTEKRLNIAWDGIIWEKVKFSKNMCQRFQMKYLECKNEGFFSDGRTDENFGDLALDYWGKGIPRSREKKF